MVRNKIDLLPPEIRNERRNSIINNNNIISLGLSASSGIGVDDLLKRLGQFASDFFGAEPALISRERHRKALESAGQALDRVLAEAERGREDIIAEELRAAAAILARLTGRIDVEDVLDVIFRDFCIGK
jgi:tRNA modification GTPase